MLDVALSREYGWQVQPHTRPYVLTRLVMQIGSARWTAGILFLSGEARVQTRSTAEGRQDHIEDRTAAGPLEQQLALMPTRDNSPYERVNVGRRRRIR